MNIDCICGIFKFLNWTTDQYILDVLNLSDDERRCVYDYWRRYTKFTQTKHTYMVNGDYHRDDDQPAIVYGDKLEWFIDGIRHRIGGPAIEYKYGGEEYWQNGKLHRYDGPAVIYKNKLEWCIDGIQHRLDGPAVISNGDQYWYANGLKHRLDGPAVEYDNGGKEWWFQGKLHRIDGPAVEYSDGFKEYYYMGYRLHEKSTDPKGEFSVMHLKNIPSDIGLYVNGKKFATVMYAYSYNVLTIHEGMFNYLMRYTN